MGGVLESRCCQLAASEPEKSQLLFGVKSGIKSHLLRVSHICPALAEFKGHGSLGPALGVENEAG